MSDKFINSPFYVSLLNKLFTMTLKFQQNDDTKAFLRNEFIHFGEKTSIGNSNAGRKPKEIGQGRVLMFNCSSSSLKWANAPKAAILRNVLD